MDKTQSADPPAEPPNRFLQLHPKNRRNILLHLDPPSHLLAVISHRTTSLLCTWTTSYCHLLPRARVQKIEKSPGELRKAFPFHPSFHSLLYRPNSPSRWSKSYSLRLWGERSQESLQTLSQRLLNLWRVTHIAQLLCREDHFWTTVRLAADIQREPPVETIPCIAPPGLNREPVALCKRLHGIGNPRLPLLNFFQHIAVRHQILLSGNASRGTTEGPKGRWVEGLTRP